MFPAILSPYPCYYLFLTLVCGLACFLYLLSQTSVVKERRQRKERGRMKSRRGEKRGGEREKGE